MVLVTSERQELPPPLLQRHLRIRAKLRNGHLTSSQIFCKHVERIQHAWSRMRAEQ